MGLAATEIADEAHASCERGTGLTSSSDRSCAHALGVDAPTAKTSATTASLLRVRGRPQVSSLLLMLFTLHPERLIPSSNSSLRDPQRPVKSRSASVDRKSTRLNSSHG